MDSGSWKHFLFYIYIVSVPRLCERRNEEKGSPLEKGELCLCLFAPCVFLALQGKVVGNHGDAFAIGGLCA
jgi:hypothetical protein